MFCRNCGREIGINSSFCTFCGTPVNVIQYKKPELNDNKNTIALIISILTSPLLVILRILLQESIYVPAGVNGSWVGHNDYYLSPPAVIIIIMVLFMSLILSVSFICMSKKRETRKAILTVFFTIINIFTAFCVSIG